MAYLDSPRGRQSSHGNLGSKSSTQSTSIRLALHVKSIDRHGSRVKTVPTHSAMGRRGFTPQDHDEDGPTVVSPEHEWQEARPIHERMLDLLLQPSQSFKTDQIPNVASRFSAQECAVIIKKARLLLAGEESLLYVAAPCRVVSDLHGQFVDLMQIMGWCGAPDGTVPWVFLGDYVDRTPYGFEVMLLLYSLKIKWPDRIFLLRGNHELESINTAYGFKQELEEKWGLQYGTSLYNAFNDSFAYMPLAGIAIPPGYEGEVPTFITYEDSRQQSDSPRKQQMQLPKYIPDRYLMMHGGIGRLEWLSEIAAVKRPLRTDYEYGGVLTDVVWSDPAPNDDDIGILTSGRDWNAGGIVRFGADRVEEFCKRNHITAILRGHEIVQEGMQIAFGGRLLTFFTAPNYPGRGTNDGVILNLALVKDQMSGNTNIEVQPIRFEANPVPYVPSIDDDAASDLTEMEPHDDGDYETQQQPSDAEHFEEQPDGQPQPQPPAYADLHHLEGDEAPALCSAAGVGQQTASVPTGTSCDPAHSERFWRSTGAAAAACGGPAPANAGAAAADTAANASVDGCDNSVEMEDGGDEIVFCPSATHSPGRRGLPGVSRGSGGAAHDLATGSAEEGDIESRCGSSPVLMAETFGALDSMPPTGARLHELRNRWELQNQGAGPQLVNAGMQGAQHVPAPPREFQHAKIVKAAPPPPPGFGLVTRPLPGSAPRVARVAQGGSTAALATENSSAQVTAAATPPLPSAGGAAGSQGSGGPSGDEDVAAATNIEAGGFWAALVAVASQQATERPVAAPVAVARGEASPPEAELFRKPPLCAALQSTCFDDEDPWDMPDTSNGPYVQRPYDDVPADAVVAADADGDTSDVDGSNTGFGSPVNTGAFGSPATSPTAARIHLSARLDGVAASITAADVAVPVPDAAAGSPPARPRLHAAFAVPSPSMLAPLLMQTAGPIYDAAADGDQAMQDIDTLQLRSDGEDDTAMRDAGGSMDVELSSEAAGHGEQQAACSSPPEAGTLLVEIIATSSPTTSPDPEISNWGASGAIQPPTEPQLREVLALAPAQGQALSFPIRAVQPCIAMLPFNLVPVMVVPASPQAGAAMVSGARAQPMPIVTGSWIPADAAAAAAVAAAASIGGSNDGCKLIPVMGAIATASLSPGIPVPSGAQSVLSAGVAGHPARPASDPPPATVRVRPVSMGSAGAATAAVAVAAATTPPRAGSGAVSRGGTASPSALPPTGSPKPVARRISEGSAVSEAVTQRADEPRSPTPPRMCREAGLIITDTASV